MAPKRAGAAIVLARGKGARQNNLRAHAHTGDMEMIKNAEQVPAQAIIMAGGKGTRLLPLTGSMPKPMVPILDKPVLQLIVSSLVRAGVTDIAMTLGYMPERIVSYFGNGRRLGAHITYFVEKTPLGTAGGVKAAEKFIKGTCVVMSGDALTTLSVADMLRSHARRPALCTMAVKKVKDPRGMGEVEPDGRGGVRAFREKPQIYKTGIVNMGIYVMEKRILDFIPPGVSDFSRDVFPAIVNRINLYQTNCYWSDIGTLTSYYRANMHAARRPELFGLNA